jgi:tetratricopeptide (TPR) repeat protein
MAPTVSFWDCGEFIATAFSLGVPHPPGSPLYLIIGRIFSLIPISSDIAFRVNIISPIVSAAAVLFLYLIIVKIIAHWRGSIKNKNDVIVAFGAAIIGAVTFAFTDSHWFNAVEAEVYSISTLFTALVVWIILHWSERADQHGNERYILVIAYLIGLATGIHLLNLLALPFIALIIYFRKQEFGWKSFLITVAVAGAALLLILNGIIKGLPKLAGLFGLVSVIIVVLAIFAAAIWSISANRNRFALAVSSLVLILVGYSSYTTIFIRSSQDPMIDENDPETITAAISYLEREQYGQVGLLPRRFEQLPPMYEVVGAPLNNREYSRSQKQQYRFYNPGRQWEYFLSYQVKKMYWRYFLWNFAGKGPSTDPGVTAFGATTLESGVNWTQFGLPLALLLGMWGMTVHISKDRKEAFALLTLFFMTGLAIILYINQDNPQPRERDYSYVGSFLTFAVWIGIGAAGILEKIFAYVREQGLGRKIAIGAVILQLVFIPGMMLKANYTSHDRSGNYVAWDMSYNMLQSCEPNGIIFTNGDNDTFPLWYLQEVEGIRRDVAVVNLALLNTEWYIKQLRDLRPEGERFITLNDIQIREIASGIQPWQKQNVRIPVVGDELNPDGFIEWTLEPTYANGQALRVQDLMILRIINDTRWKYPVYFAVTVSNSNKIGLDDYLAMEGLSFKLYSHKVENINPDLLYENLMTDVGKEAWSVEFTPAEFIGLSKDTIQPTWSTEYQPGYLYRNLGNSSVYYNPSTVRLLQNYRTAYLQLVVHHFFKFRDLSENPDADPAQIAEIRSTILTILTQMDKNIPPDVISYDSGALYYQFGYILGKIGETEKLRQILEELVQRRDSSVDDLLRYGQTYAQELNDFELAKGVFEDLNETYLSLEDAISRQGLKKTRISQEGWNRWQHLYPEIVSSLVITYRTLEDWAKAEQLLIQWLERNPTDTSAQELLKEVQENLTSLMNG